MEILKMMINRSKTFCFDPFNEFHGGYPLRFMIYSHGGSISRARRNVGVETMISAEMLEPYSALQVTWSAIALELYFFFGLVPCLSAMLEDCATLGAT